MYNWVSLNDIYWELTPPALQARKFLKMKALVSIFLWENILVLHRFPTHH